MSISFAKNKNIANEIGRIVGELELKTSKEEIANHFLKIFDAHYLNYINQRKQRDLIILNCFYKKVFENAKINKNFKKDNSLSDFFETKKGTFEINDNILPIALDENVFYLEKEIEILKSFALFFEDLFLKDTKNSYYLNVLKKIEKIKSLTDESFLNRITKSKNIKNEIFKQIGCITNFDKIKVNYLFYNNLKKECKLYNFDI